uniref:Uncharacterized protein n=1 Tax=Meloidogyne floridensis TaxID=298350 RepID=A0A915NI91_9BILA
MLLFKHGRNRAAAFGMLWELLLLALIHQVAGEVVPESSSGPPVAVAPSAANTVGFGRHTKSGDKVKLASGEWNPAASPEDLKVYKEAGAMNPCDDIEYEKETGDMLPFIYSRTVAEFQSMRFFQPATGDGCPGSCSGNTVCRKWTGLAAGFANYGGKLLRTVAGIGDPGGSYCGLANSVGENDVSYKITVDNGNMHWFKSEGCAWEEGGFPRDTQCVNKNSMAQELGEKITWETEPPKGEFTRLFTFALLPQKGARVHTRNKIEGEGLGGPKCDELYVKFPGSSFKLLVPGGSAPPQAGETLEPPPVTAPDTPPPVQPAEEGGGSLAIVVVIVIIVVIV